VDGNVLFVMVCKGTATIYANTRELAICVAYGSVRDWDQNGTVINVLLGADQEIKMNSGRLISTDQCTFSDTKEAWLRFCPLNSHTIKRSRASEWS